MHARPAGRQSWQGVGAQGAGCRVQVWEVGCGVWVWGVGCGVQADDDEHSTLRSRSAPRRSAANNPEISLHVSSVRTRDLSSLTISLTPCPPLPPPLCPRTFPSLPSCARTAPLSPASAASSACGAAGCECTRRTARCAPCARAALQVWSEGSEGSNAESEEGTGGWAPWRREALRIASATSRSAAWIARRSVSSCV